MTKYPYDLKLICQHCETRFEANFFKHFCSHRCRGAFFQQRNVHIWTEEEVEFVSGLIGTLPTSHIVSKLRERFPYIKTSAYNIKEKLGLIAKEIGESLLDTSDHYSMKEWGRLLGTNNRRIKHWISLGLKHTIDGQFYRISENDLKKFARHNPNEFAYIKKVYLDWLFPNEPTIVEIITKLHPRKYASRAVKCIDTSRVYPSVLNAQQKLGIGKYWITRSAKSNGSLTTGESGLRFIYLD